ncbi:MAG: T9SS type A sorting domain-containing protein [Flavobacteriales bacterium]|nr:T9SS type A sorting domain-containing protein [Flavobacteriales bacterium]
MKTIYLLFFCFLTNLSFGQYIILTNATSNTSCDGSVIFNYEGAWQFQSGYTAWKKIEGNDTILIQEGGTYLSNLCIGNYLLEAKDATFDYPSVSKFKITATSIIDCGDYAISSLVNEPYDFTYIYDKVVTEVYNGTPPYDYYFDGILLAADYQIQSYHYNSLVLGQHSVKVVDSIGCVDSIVVNLVDYDTCRYYLSMGYNNYSNETVTNACDGTFQLIPINISDSTYIANYIQIDWDSGQTGFTLTNLCPGFTFGTVTIETINPNQAPCVSRRYVKIEDALDSVFVYGDYVNSQNILYSDWTDECSIDLTAIQSAEIIDFSFINPDSILVTWEVRDTNQVVATIYAGYSIPNTSENYNFVLRLYCLQKSFPIYAHTIDQQYIGELSVSNSTLVEVSIAPNPAENFLQVKSKVDYDTYLISDMSGKIVRDQTFTPEINIEGLQSGMYLLHLRHNENLLLVKFVKN